MSMQTMSTALPVEEIASHAAEADATARFPTESIEALARAGYLGLGIGGDWGGPGGGPADVVNVVEQVAAACASTAMIFTMHLVAAQTLVAGTSADEASGPKGVALQAMAAGRHLSTLAYSEKGSRSHFWAQVSRAVPVNGNGKVTIDADKSWATGAGHVDSYVTATGTPGGTSPVDTELYLVPASAAGLSIPSSFDGLGLRANASAPLRLRGVAVGTDSRLGATGSGFGLMLSATLPWFVLCSGACCVGLAGAALDVAAKHVTGARFEHLGSSLADLPTIRARLAEAKIQHMQARALLYQVADQVAAGAPEAQLGVLALKAAASEMAIAVTDSAMRVCGGAAFSKHLPLERMFRDARAASVMAPTTDVLYDFVGKAICGMDLF